MSPNIPSPCPFFTFLFPYSRTTGGSLFPPSHIARFILRWCQACGMVLSPYQSSQGKRMATVKKSVYTQPFYHHSVFSLGGFIWFRAIGSLSRPLAYPSCIYQYSYVPTPCPLLPCRYRTSRNPRVLEFNRFFLGTTWL